jgi:hypothetical protein
MGFESSAPSREITKRRNTGAEWEFELTVGAFVIPAGRGMVYPIEPRQRVQARKGNTSCTALEKPSLFVASSRFGARIMMSR